MDHDAIMVGKNILAPDDRNGNACSVILIARAQLNSCVQRNEIINYSTTLHNLSLPDSYKVRKTKTK